MSAGGRLDEGKVFTEEDWALDEGSTPYEKSKTRAEKAAWELVNNLPGLYKYRSLSLTFPDSVFNVILVVFFLGWLECVCEGR